MFSGWQVDYYQTFGFVVLPGYLGAGETADLGHELDQALRTATVGASVTMEQVAPSGPGCR